MQKTPEADRAEGWLEVKLGEIISTHLRKHTHTHTHNGSRSLTGRIKTKHKHNRRPHIDRHIVASSYY